MGDSHDKGAFQADIPANAVEEALRSLERLQRGASGEAGPGEPAAAEGEAVAVEVEGGPDAAGAELDPAALAERVASLEAQLELSQAKARETLERLREEHDRLLRAAADLDNAKKRAQRERDDIQKFGIEKLLKDLLPVLDNLDRALASAPPEGALYDGVRLVQKAFEQGIAKHGVRPFSAMGKPFDPAQHEALLQVPTGAQPPGTVVLEHARGFMLHDRLLRPAMVGVAVGTDAAAGGAGPGAQG